MTAAQPVVFDFAEWQASFPELSFVTQAQATMYFNIACMRVNNGPCADIIDQSDRQLVLYMLVAHIALLMSQAANVSQPVDSDGNPITGTTATVTAGLTGRVSSAKEGSVSVATESLSSSNASSLERWLGTTQYGQLAWEMLAPLFGPQYFPGPSRIGYQLP